jgi:hypothetical protein
MESGLIGARDAFEKEVSEKGIMCFGIWRLVDPKYCTISIDSSVTGHRPT